MNITKQFFGTTASGEQADLFTLTNNNGMKAVVSNYGGIIVELHVPDKNNETADVVLGFDDLKGYETHGGPYFGALIGRYGNRISKGQFTLNGTTYNLPINNGPNSLHGGEKGFDKVVWAAETSTTDTEASLTLKHTSVDGDQGYPGNLDVTAVYTLTDKNELKLDYTATTDADTIVNLTNHSYFNLSGTGSAMNHEIIIKADSYVPCDDTSIPFGEIAPVEETPMDFRSSRVIGEHVEDDFVQLTQARGYDHTYVLHQDGALKSCAVLTDPKSGRIMETFTTEPGVQFYSANWIGGTPGKSGVEYNDRDAICLETQHYPDSPNKPAFPSTVLKKDEIYRSTTVYAFSAK